MTQKKTDTPPKKNNPQSFRIKLGGSSAIWTTSELRSMLMRAVDTLDEDGITHVRSCNLYIPPVDAAGNAVVRVRGHALKDVVIAAPYRSAADEYNL